MVIVLKNLVTMEACGIHTVPQCEDLKGLSLSGSVGRGRGRQGHSSQAVCDGTWLSMGRLRPCLRESWCSSWRKCHRPGRAQSQGPSEAWSLSCGQTPGLGNVPAALAALQCRPLPPPRTVFARRLWRVHSFPSSVLDSTTLQCFLRWYKEGVSPQALSFLLTHVCSCLCPSDLPAPFAHSSESLSPRFPEEQGQVEKHDGHRRLHLPGRTHGSLNLGPEPAVTFPPLTEPLFPLLTPQNQTAMGKPSPKCGPTVPLSGPGCGAGARCFSAQPQLIPGVEVLPGIPAGPGSRSVQQWRAARGLQQARGCGQWLSG